MGLSGFESLGLFRGDCRFEGVECNAYQRLGEHSEDVEHLGEGERKQARTKS